MKVTKNLKKGSVVFSVDTDNLYEITFKLGQNLKRNDYEIGCYYYQKNYSQEGEHEDTCRNGECVEKLLNNDYVDFDIEITIKSDFGTDTTGELSKWLIADLKEIQNYAQKQEVTLILE